MKVSELKKKKPPYMFIEDNSVFLCIAYTPRYYPKEMEFYGSRILDKTIIYKYFSFPNWIDIFPMPDPNPGIMRRAIEVVFQMPRDNK